MLRRPHEEYGGDLLLRTTLMKACRGVPELQYALFKPADNVEHLLADLRASVETHLALITTSQFPLTLLDHSIITIHAISTTSTVDTITTALEADTDIQVNDPAADTDKATTVETTGLKAVVTTILATITATGQRSVLFVDKKAVGQLNTLRMTDKGQGPTYHSMPLHRCYILDYEGHEMSSFDDTEDTWEEHDNSTNDHRNNGKQAKCSEKTSIRRIKPDRFQGIMIDTAGYSQYIALQREDPSVALDSSTSGQASIKFGNGDTINSLGTVALKTPLGRITFHILQTPTPFLLCLADMDRLGIYFNNITDTINCSNHCTNRPTSIPVIRKWGHPWFFLTKDEESISFLTETEIRTLHRRFGHPAVPRLHHLLKQAGHSDVSIDTLETISNPTPLQVHPNDDQEFNYEIIVDVMHLGTPQRPVLHVVDSATAFKEPDFYRQCQLKIHGRPSGPSGSTRILDLLIPSVTMQELTLLLSNSGTKQRLWGSNALKYLLRRIGPLESYHASLRRAFNILHAEIGHTTSAETVLQMAVKAINDTAGPDGLVPTLLVFGAYPRVSTDSPPSASTLKRSEAMQKAMKMLRQLSAERRVKDALHARNGPSTTEVLSSRCKVKFAFGERKTIASIDSHNITIDTVNGPQVFRSTLVQPYLRDDTTLSDPTHDTDPQAFVQILMNNRLKTPTPTRIKEQAKDLIMIMAQAVDQSFLTQKEEDAQLFPQATITDLVGRGVFQFERYDQMIKGINTKPYEKSRLVIQGHNDFEKTTLLTQSPTIQRAYPQSQTKLSGPFLRICPRNYKANTLTEQLFQHHLEKLDMSTSTYDSCLLISNTGPDTLGIVECKLMTPSSLERTTFLPPKTDITYGTTVDFNGARLTSKMTTIDPKAIDRHQRYVEERARASYIASIAQPEAFDVSVAAQVQTPEDKDYAILNKRLQWQMDHQLRGLTYKPIDLATAKLMVFTDGSFANNKDLSSQLGFVITLVNETNHKEKQFEISGNIVHWSSTKCKRVTRSVLASEIYGMANGFDIGISLAMTMKIITERLNLPPILSSSVRIRTLYECLVKLGTTKEKRLMIDIMALRQSYEKREITDIRWINGADNPADAMTKASPNRALERFIDTNSLTIRVEGYEDPSLLPRYLQLRTRRRTHFLAIMTHALTAHSFTALTLLSFRPVQAKKRQRAPFLHAGLCLLR
ncbi:cwf18 domain containing protein [Hirsutella rhossiliensis]